VIARAAQALLDQIDPSPGVRLLGVSGSNLCAPAEQLGLFDSPATGAGGHGERDGSGAAWTEASVAIDVIRERFGAAAIAPASTLRAGAIRPVRKGAQQWGPDEPDSAGSVRADGSRRREPGPTRVV
jgi:DNA polymerase-4